MADPVIATSTAVIVTIISGLFGVIGIGVGVTGPFISGMRAAASKHKEDAEKAVTDMAAVKADNRVQLAKEHNTESERMQVERESMWTEARKMRDDLSTRIDSLSAEVKGLKETIVSLEATITELRTELRLEKELKQAAQDKLGGKDKK